MPGELPITDRTFPPWVFHHPVRRLLTRAGPLVEFCGPRTGETVADLGAGGGYFLAELRRRVGPHSTIYEVDIDPAALDRARVAAKDAGGGSSTEFLCTSAASVPQIPDGSVDLVIANGLLCCLADKAGALEEAWRILKPGGRALVTFQTLSRGWTARGRALRLTDRQFVDLVRRRRGRVLEGRRRPFGRVYRLEKPAV
jgi:ubiquinone/menaquinone biosynthesis C-methylase UbiE